MIKKTTQYINIYINKRRDFENFKLRLKKIIQCFWISNYLFEQMKVICQRLETLPATRTQAKISTTLMMKMNK